MIQQGVFSIPSGAQDVSVNFPTTFSSTPDVLLPTIFSTSGDAQLLQAFLVAKTASSFTVRLTAPTPSANYLLCWMAGPSLAFDIGSTYSAGRSMASLPVVQSQYGDVVLTYRPYPVPQLCTTPVTPRISPPKVITASAATGPGDVVIVCQNTGAIVVTLPDVRLFYPGQIVRILKQNAGVTISTDAGANDQTTGFSAPLVAGSVTRLVADPDNLTWYQS